MEASSRITEKTWREQPYDGQQARILAEALGVDELYARLLVQRGVGTAEEARRFFLPETDHLHDSALMRDLPRAVERIDRAVRAKEAILIYGDYDVDGTSAVALVYGFLRERHARLGFYIPDRHLEGYGLSMKGIAHAAEGGYTLLITLDCGTKAHAEVARAASLGIDVIICDHHLPDAGPLPPAYAVLNPKRADCDYPYPELSGCGVGYKVVSALARRWDAGAGELEAGLQLAALSIAADVVPVTGENRVMMRLGLASLEARPLPGLRALLTVAQKEGLFPASVSGEDLAFLAAPRINAAGRLGEAREAVRLLLEKDSRAAALLARKLHEANEHRRLLDQRITGEAQARILADTMPRAATVVYDPAWHKGVIGIVAARLLETRYRPTIVLTRSGEYLTGSARSVRTFHMTEALAKCGDLLENFGGHFFAAGLTLRPENLEAFTARFEELAASGLGAGGCAPEILIDAPLTLSHIRQKFYNTLRRFGPFGPGNHEPVFFASALRDTGRSRIVGEAHIRFEVTQGASVTMTGIGFGMAAKFGLVASGEPFDMCFHVGENHWKGQRSLQLKVLDIRPPLSART